MDARAQREEVYELSAFSVEDKGAPGYMAETETRAGMSSFSASLPTRVSLGSQREPSRFPIFSKGFQPQFWSEVVSLIQDKGFLKSNPTKHTCLLYTSPSPRDRTRSRMPSSA